MKTSIDALHREVVDLQSKTTYSEAVWRSGPCPDCAGGKRNELTDHASKKPTGADARKSTLA